MSDKEEEEEIGIFRLSDLIAGQLEGSRKDKPEEDGTFIMNNTDNKKNVEVGDTLVRDMSDGHRDLKVHMSPKLVGDTTMSDGSKEPVYEIRVRRRRPDLGE